MLETEMLQMMVFWVSVKLIVIRKLTSFVGFSLSLDLTQKAELGIWLYIYFEYFSGDLKLEFTAMWLHATSGFRCLKSSKNLPIVSHISPLTDKVNSIKMESLLTRTAWSLWISMAGTRWNSSRTMAAFTLLAMRLASNQPQTHDLNGFIYKPIFLSTEKAFV